MGSVTNTGKGAPGSGPALYEQEQAVHEYLQFHFAREDAVMPYPFGPKDGLAFPHALAAACARHAPPNATHALDLGCAVGGSAFTLAASFDHVVGVDFSNAFVAAAEAMREKHACTYRTLVEGSTYETASASLTESQKASASKCRFFVGDACTVTASEAGGSAFDVVLMANLLCRVPDPRALLANVKALLKGPGGVVVLASPFSWTEAFTPKDRWLGGYDGADGKPVDSSAELRKEMARLGFELVEAYDAPFVIREHRRKFQFGVSHVTVFRLQ